jgi:hypothetical protein
MAPECVYLDEIEMVTTGEDQGLGSESMLDSVQTDGSASFWCFGARALLSVEPVGSDLFVCSHRITSRPMVAGGCKRIELFWIGNAGKALDFRGKYFGDVL